MQLELYDLAGGNGLVAGIHSLNGSLVPAQVDERGLVVADVVHKLVDEADPLVEVGVLAAVHDHLKIPNMATPGRISSNPAGGYFNYSGNTRLLSIVYCPIHRFRGQTGVRLFG